MNRMHGFLVQACISMRMHFNVTSCFIRTFSVLSSCIYFSYCVLRKIFDVMDDLQSSDHAGLSRSCNPPSYINRHGSRVRASTVSESESKRGYDTFAEFPGNSSEIRSRSVSMTFATCGPRAVKRTSFALQSDRFEPRTRHHIPDRDGQSSCSSDDSASVDEVR